MYAEISPNQSILLSQGKYQNCFHRFVKCINVSIAVRVNETYTLKQKLTQVTFPPIPPLTYFGTVFFS